MNTITQLVPPIKQKASNKLEDSLSKLESSMQQDDVRKLLLIDVLTGGRSKDLVGNLQDLEASTLEISHGIDDLYTKVNIMQPDVLILSVDVLGKIILEQLTQIHERCPLPVIVVAKQYTRSVVKTIVCEGVSSYLVGEVSMERLMVVVDLSIARFAQQQSLIFELQMAKEKLSERKLIERAKGIIMKQKNLSEEDAYLQMRKSAMNQGHPMADLAKRIISVFEMLE